MSRGTVIVASDGDGNAAPGCRFLEWDSEFFGHRIARIDPAALVQDTPAVTGWCVDQRIECAYLLVDPASPSTIRVAEANGFGLVDLRVTMRREGAREGALPAEGSVVVRPAEDADLDALRAIARASHHDTRFYADGRFDRGRCDAFYDVWIAKSCGGWADRVFVVESGGAPTGYVTCILHPDQGQIGLIGIAEGMRGTGHGRALVANAVHWFSTLGRQDVIVVTQGRNTAALRFYHGSGFGVQSIDLWYHKWF